MGWFFGPSVTVDTYRLWGRDQARRIEHVAPLVVEEVERRLRARLGSVRVTLTTPDGLAERACEVEAHFAPEATPQQRERLLRTARREAREVAGRAVLDPGDWGSVLFLNARSQAMQDPEGMVTVLAHELVHCAQFNRPKVRERLIASIRNNFEVEPLPRRAVRELNAMVEDHEREAYRLEAVLARRVLKEVA